MNNKEVGLLGSGGQADEAESFLAGRQVVFRAVDREYIDGDSRRLVDVKSPSDSQANTPVVAVVGSPALRRQLIESWPGDKYTSVISEYASIANASSIGEGSIVAPQAAITTNVKVGKHALINAGATIGHDSVLGDYATISPGVNIGGRVQLGNGVFVGIGASIINGVRIADGVVVGAGAVVVSDIDTPNAVYVGVPAKMISQNEGWVGEI